MLQDNTDNSTSDNDNDDNDTNNEVSVNKTKNRSKKITNTNKIKQKSQGLRIQKTNNMMSDKDEDDQHDHLKKVSVKVFSDSIPNGIRVKEFNNYIKAGNAHFKPFPGSTIKQLHHYVIPTLNDEKPDAVVIHVGINDLLSRNRNVIPEDKIASEITEIGNRCREKGTETVFISSIIFNNRIEWERIERINQELKERCERLDFIYIENNNINAHHLWRDGLHLRENGKILLANNFINSINKNINNNFLRLVTPQISPT